MRIKNLFLLLLCLVISGQAVAQTKEQRQRLEMMKILHELISQHKELGYSNLWEAFATTDWHPATAEHPNGYVWDMYSNVINENFQAQGSDNSSIEGKVYSREHTVPQSWFGSAKPMESDLFQIYPVDGKINSLRNAHPYGEVKTVTSGSAGNYSKYGPATAECGSPVPVFEPADEYKGDLARTYFYMAVCYSDKIDQWTGEVFGQSPLFADYPGYPGMTEWALRMFIKWSKNDPVSEKERDRNNAVHKLQGNRNPFIDSPGLERFVWADYVE